MMISKLPALLKREILEHKNIWRVPVILICIAVLVRLSLSFGNLEIDINVPDVVDLDGVGIDTKGLDDNIEGVIGSVMDGVVGRALNAMNYIIMLVMFIVSIFYTLSSLYNERQDQSVLFWRSLPISDSLTIASKLIIALLLIPLVIVVSQAIVSVIFLDTQAMQYLSSYFAQSLGGLIKVMLWSMLPTIAWCLLCSEIAKKNPFLLAFVAPIIVVLVDKLFLSGAVSELLVINRLTGIDDYQVTPLITGFVFGAICIVLATVKRSQRI